MAKQFASFRATIATAQRPGFEMTGDPQDSTKLLTFETKNDPRDNQKVELAIAISFAKVGLHAVALEFGQDGEFIESLKLFFDVKVAATGRPLNHSAR
jgi:hypothetical protein